jgi:hypothetical protein
VAAGSATDETIDRLVARLNVRDALDSPSPGQREVIELLRAAW